jgi:hypothetical protein
MYSNYVIGFGIGWCLAYIITLIILSGKGKGSKAGKAGEAVTSGGVPDKIKAEIDKLMSGITGLRTEYKDSRWDQIKKLGNDFARNPKAFKYDFDSLIQGPESKAKALDGQMEEIINKFKSIMTQIETSFKNPPTPVGPGGDGGSGIKPIINYIGISGIIIANLLIFVIKF